MVLFSTINHQGVDLISHCQGRGRAPVNGLSRLRHDVLLVLSENINAVRSTRFNISK